MVFPRKLSFFFLSFLLLKTLLESSCFLSNHNFNNFLFKEIIFSAFTLDFVLSVFCSFGQSKL